MVRLTIGATEHAREVIPTPRSPPNVFQRLPRLFNSRPAQPFLAKQSVGPFFPGLAQGRDRLLPVVDRQVEAAAIIGGIEDGLKIERSIAVLGAKGDLNNRKPLGEANRPE